MIASDKLKKLTWLLFVMFVFLLAFGPSGFKYFWPVYLVMSFSALIWTLYLVYVCEKFVVYITSMIITIVGIFSLMACTAAYLIAAKLWGKTSVAALMIWPVPMGIVSLTYLVLASGNSSFHPFEYDGIKVQPRPQKEQKASTAYSPLLVGGATSLATSIFIKAVGSLATGMFIMFGMTVCSVTFLFYARHIIRGLRTLRIQEKSLPTPYTFMQIDEIRAARSRWWMSRLFKWVGAWRKSPNA